MKKINRSDLRKYITNIMNESMVRDWSVGMPAPDPNAVSGNFDLAIGGNMGGETIDNSSFPQDFEIDYVQVSQRGCY